MSAALKAATVASGLGLFSAASLYSLRTPKQDFSAQAQRLEHTAEGVPSTPAAKPKLPSNFVSFTIGKYELTNAPAA